MTGVREETLWRVHEEVQRVVGGDGLTSEISEGVMVDGVVIGDVFANKVNFLGSKKSHKDEKSVKRKLKSQRKRPCK